jgi:hypothetical protein
LRLRENGDLVADFYREGANQVDVYEVTREDGVPTLHVVRRDR